MTQQEINQYFVGAGYTEDPANTFVDPTGQFTFVNGQEQLSFVYLGLPSPYEAAIMNSFVANVEYLENWISVMENSALNPPELLQ